MDRPPVNDDRIDIDLAGPDRTVANVLIGAGESSS